MATNALSEALANLNFGAGDTGWGVAASSLAGVAPKLINPYGSVGQNLGVGLGSVLLTALLQYQGKRDALASSLEANTIANDLMSKTTTPEERVAYVKNLEQQGIDSDVLGKISTLSTALTQSDKEALVESAARKDQAMQTLYATVAKEQGIPFSEAPKWLEARNQAITQGNAIAAGLPGAVGASARAGQVPYALQSADERRAALETRQKAADKIMEAKTNIASSKDYTDFADAKKNLTVLEQMPERNTEAAKQAAIKLFERTMNPGNQVTLNEMDSTGKSDATYTKWKLWWNGLSPDERGLRVAQLSPEAMNELVDISRMVVDSLGARFNSRVTGTVAALKTGPMPMPDEWANVGNISPTGKLHLNSGEKAQKIKESTDLQNAIVTLTSRTDIPNEAKQSALLKARARLQEIQDELSPFE